MSNEFSISLERAGDCTSFAVRATGIYSRQQVFRVQNNLRPYSVLQHSDHAAGPRPRREC